MTTKKYHNGRRPKDWAAIGFADSLGVFELSMTKEAIAPAVGYQEFVFPMPASDMIELRDALTKALKMAGVEK